jgi:putative spermidine/putrescine transport system permease protein
LRRAGDWRPVLGNAWALLLLAPLVVLLAGLVGYPLVKLGIDSLTTGDGIGNYRAVLESAAGRRALIATVLSAAVVAILATAIGGVIAWHLRTTRSRLLQATLWIALLVPLFMGTVAKNYAFVLLLADNGPLNAFLEALGFEGLSLLYTSGAVVAGIVYTMVPFAALPLYGVFRSIDESLVAAARGMGASRLRATASVTIPLAMPGIVASVALIFAIALGFYVTPVLLGGAQAPFMATLIENYLLASFDYPLASAASVILLGTAFVILALGLRLLGRERLLRALA